MRQNACFICDLSIANVGFFFLGDLRVAGRALFWTVIKYCVLLRGRLLALLVFF